jgi:hypothetical protein
MVPGATLPCSALKMSCGVERNSILSIIYRNGANGPDRAEPEGAMDRESEDRIRARAHELWEQAGKPKGREEEFWLRAERELSEERIRHELKTPDNL